MGGIILIRKEVRYMPTVEIKLHEIMAKRNIKTIEQLHKLSGLSRKSISKAYNKKNKRIDVEALATLCKVLDCEISDLLVLENEEEKK
jgi:putative transcriptional regulator